MIKSGLGILGALILAVGVGPVSAGPGNVLISYENPAAPQPAEFGSSVASFEGRIVAAAPEVEGGTVYLINPLTGDSAVLPKPAGVIFGNFGAEVIAKGENLYVSDPLATVSGAVGYGAVFVYSSSSDSSPLVLANPASSIDTGFAFSFDANAVGEVIIGAPGGRKAYVYAPGSATHRLVVDAPQPYHDQFGYRVAISTAGKLVIAPHHSAMFSQEILLFHSNGAYFDNLMRPAEHITLVNALGRELTVENEVLYTADIARLGPGGPDARAIYSFNLNTGDLISSYTDTTANQALGVSIHSINGLLAVGSPTPLAGDDLDAENDDIVFLNSDLTFVARATRPAAEGFGFQLASIGSFLVAGAPDYADQQGRVYLMETPVSGDTVNAPDFAGLGLSVQTDCKSKTTKKGTKTSCKISGTISVMNYGLADSGKKKASITLYHSTDAVLSADDRRAGKAKVGGVPAFGISVATFNGKTKTAASGTYLIAVIDDKGKLPESNENNNILVYGPMP